MRVDIKPQWKQLADWYWESLGGWEGAGGRSIWEMLEQDYGAVKVFSMTNIHEERGMWVRFPDEKSYVAFILRWG